MDTLVVLVGIALVFGPWVLAIVALVKAKSGERRAAGTARSVAALTDSVERLKRDLDGLRGTPGRPAAEEPPPEQEAAAEAPPPEPEAPTPEPEPEPEPQPAAAAPPPPWQAAPARQPVTLKSLEEALTARWLVWLGAVAVALSATFFVKYAMDRGWLSPAVRVSLGFLFGVALAFGGEWLRERPLQRAIAAVRPNYVPPALTAAGVFTCFASIYAAYALYGLLSPLVAFIGLAAVALAAVGMSLLQGWFVALLGLLGAFITPALVQTTAPSAWALFLYLLAVLVASLALVRYRGWWWLGYAALAGAGIWPLLWMGFIWKSADALPVGIYLLLMAGAFLHLHYGMAKAEAPDSWRAEIRAAPVPARMGWIGALTVAVLLYLMVHRAHYGAASLVFVGLLGVLYLVAGRRTPVFDALSVAAAALMLVLMATWPLPPDVTRAAPMYTFGDVVRGAGPGSPGIPPELTAFTVSLFAFAGLFGIGGFALLWGARRPAMWAGVSAAAPVLLLAIAYWRIVDFRLDLGWALVALALAATSLGAAARVARHRYAAGLVAPLGFYAAAVVAFLSLGVTMTLQQAWLTVALSLQLPALGWIYRRVPVRPIQATAVIVALVVLVRLVFNHNVLDYPLGGHSPLFSWVVYGYGIPAVMFFWAARLFRGSDADQLVMLLEAGALAFAVLLVSMEIRLFVAGSLVSLHYGLLEQSLQSIVWLGVGYGLAVRYSEATHRVWYYGARILIGLAISQIVLLQLWHSNPILTGEFVGRYPLVNLLLLAYAIPAVFALLLAAAFDRLRAPQLARGLAVLAFVLIFAWVSLEVRRLFQGAHFTRYLQSDAESYAYSLAWLVYAGLLLALGIFRGRTALRYASLVVLLVTVIKVFVFDMAGLAGLYRVASFLGLGLSLIGIGYLYQKFVFQRPAAQPPEDATAAE